MDTTKATVRNIEYTVKNGWCIVKINSLKPLTSGSEITILPEGTLPKSDSSLVCVNLISWNTTPIKGIIARVGVNGEIAMWCANGNENVVYFGSISYPVAE